jgi:hypothetical protein
VKHRNLLGNCLGGWVITTRIKLGLLRMIPITTNMLKYKCLFTLSPTMSLGKNSVRLTMTWISLSQRHFNFLLRLRSRTTRCGNFNCGGRLLNGYHLHWSHLSFWDQLEKSSATTLQPSSLSKCNSCILPNLLASQDIVDF